MYRDRLLITLVLLQAEGSRNQGVRMVHAHAPVIDPTHKVRTICVFGNVFVHCSMMKPRIVGLWSCLNDGRHSVYMIIQCLCARVLDDRVPNTRTLAQHVRMQTFPDKTSNENQACSN